MSAQTAYQITHMEVQQALKTLERARRHFLEIQLLCHDMPNAEAAPLLNAPTEEDHANATLIAAAPDLLEALQELCTVPNKHRPDSVWDAARAAIAKATEVRP
jgi:hypothetical protein